MIRLLGGQDGGLVEALPADSLSAMRIRALWKAYGTGYEFVRFYAEGSGSAAVCVQDGFAVLWLRSPAKQEAVSEAAAFLPLAARSFLSELPLPVEGFRATQGRTYRCSSPTALWQEGVDNNLQAGYEVLSRVFPEAINENTYQKWYADLSHRVRHGMSKIYTLEGGCTGVRYCVEGGRLAVVQLATLPELRGRGLARSLLAHMAADSHPEQGILLQSQDADSDRFYESLGYEEAGSWYCYGSAT